MKQKSRTKRWEEAAAKAVDALTELQELQQEYSDWFDNLPESLFGSTVSDKLEAVIDFDIEGALEIVNEADGADLPLGFGRD